MGAVSDPPRCPPEGHQGPSDPSRGQEPSRQAIAAAAARLGCSPQTITRHIEMGNLAALDIATQPRKRYFRVSDADLSAFEAARAAGSALEGEK